MTPSAESHRRDWSLMGLAAALCAAFFLFPLALDHALMDPDEGLHAAIAQEMAERGDWLVPRLVGQPFWDKPALFTWLQALSLRFWGMNEAAVRLPGLLAGLIAVAATGWAAGRLAGRICAMVAAVFYATMTLPVALSQAATADALLVPTVTGAVVLLWEAGQAVSARVRWQRVIVAGVLLGVAVLAKGLLGPALVGAGYLSYLAVRPWIAPGARVPDSPKTNRPAHAARRRELALLLPGLIRLGVAVLVGLAIAAPWYLAMERHNPGYLHYYFVDRHLRGFATQTQRHGDQPWWYYLPVLLAGGLPWIALLPAAARHSWASLGRREAPPEPPPGAPTQAEAAPTTCLSRAGAPATPPAVLAPDPSQRHPSPFDRILLVWCWLLGGMGLLSLAGSKLVTYLWPVFPAVAILAAWVWVETLQRRSNPAIRRAVRRTLRGAACLLPAALPCGALFAEREFGLEISWPVWVVCLAVASTAWAGLWFVRRKALRAALAVVCLNLAAQFVVGMVALMPQVAEALSARCLAEYLNRRGGLPARLLMVDQRVGSIIFYLDPELRAALGPETIQRVRISRLPPAEAGVLVAVAEQNLQKAAQWVALEEAPFEKAGRFRLYEAEALRARKQSPFKRRSGGETPFGPAHGVVPASGRSTRSSAAGR